MKIIKIYICTIKATEGTIIQVDMVMITMADMAMIITKEQVTVTMEVPIQMIDIITMGKAQDITMEEKISMETLVWNSV